MKFQTAILVAMILALNAYAQDLKIESITLDKTKIELPCRPGVAAESGFCNDDLIVRGKVAVSGSTGNNLTFQRTVSGGRLVSKGQKEFVWDLAGVAPGTYSITFAPIEGDRYGEPRSVFISVVECSHCRTGDPCISVSLEAPESATLGELVKVKAVVSGAGDHKLDHSWTVSAGEIVSGQGTNEVTVRIGKDVAADDLTVNVDVPNPVGFMNCQTSASTSIRIPQPSLVDEFVFVAPNNGALKARLDSYLIQIDNNPVSRPVIFVYAKTDLNFRKTLRVINQHLKFRAFDATRITITRGTSEKDGLIKFWIVPPGAQTPKP